MELVHLALDLHEVHLLFHIIKVVTPLNHRLPVQTNNVQPQWRRYAEHQGSVDRVVAVGVPRVVLRILQVALVFDALDEPRINRPEVGVAVAGALYVRPARLRKVNQLDLELIVLKKIIELLLPKQLDLIDLGRNPLDSLTELSRETLFADSMYAHLVTLCHCLEQGTINLEEFFLSLRFVAKSHFAPHLKRVLSGLRFGHNIFVCVEEQIWQAVSALTRDKIPFTEDLTQESCFIMRWWRTIILF